MTSTTQVNRENVLITLDGEYNENVHATLSKILHNIASNKVRTNPTLSIEDLKQEAWVRILETIEKNLSKGRELEINYLITTAQTTMLAYCQKTSKKQDNIDDFATMLMSAADNGGDRYNQLNVSKAKLEYELQTNRLDNQDAALLRIALDDTIERLEDPIVKNLIIIRYIKECNGESVKLNRMYDEFRESLDNIHRNMLDNMKKYTGNAAFKVFGMRATDNSSTPIRNAIKEALAVLNEM